MGHSDHTVKALSGHSTTRMLERYTHPTAALQVDAIETGAFVVTKARRLQIEDHKGRWARKRVSPMSSD